MRNWQDWMERSFNLAPELLQAVAILPGLSRIALPVIIPAHVKPLFSLVAEKADYEVVSHSLFCMKPFSRPVVSLEFIGFENLSV